MSDDGKATPVPLACPVTEGWLEHVAAQRQPLTAEKYEMIVRTR